MANLAVVAPLGANDTAVVAAAAQPAQIPNPGIAVSLRAENNLKLMYYYVRYKLRTCTPITPDTITRVTVQALIDYRAWGDKHEDIHSLKLNSKDWPRTIDGIKKWLRGCLGITKISLAYVIRESTNVGQIPLTEFPSLQDELIARVPIIDPINPLILAADYLVDQAKV